jgi:NAD(P)-dependent dehydrogenase (short-subunit alcohol dehydrogenase family)
MNSPSHGGLRWEERVGRSPDGLRREEHVGRSRDNVAIVTGASRGLGRALAEGVAAAGWGLVIDGRDPSALAEARWALPADTVAIAGDITDSSHRHALFEAASDLGPLSLVVNNAGILGPSPQPDLANYWLPSLREVYEVNVFAPLCLTQLTLPALRAANGALVMVTSDAAVEAYERWGGYGSAKAAVEGLARVLAVEEPAVRVWAVDPGDLRTRMHQEAFPGEDISDRPEPAAVVPAFLRLLRDRPASGRIRLADLAVPA